MPPFRLVLRYLTRHKLRLSLTVLSMGVAVFLLCMLRSLVVALDSGVRAAASNRLVVQSAVSLFVDLPEAYEAKIRAVEGVDEVTRFQWFGGIYQDRSNFFAQYGVDADRLLDVYPELIVTRGAAETFVGRRDACLVGRQLAEKYGFAVGDTIPLIGTIFPRNDSRPWEFTVAGIYRSSKKNVDEGSLFFHFDYLRETLEAGGATGPSGVGVFVVRIAAGADPTQVAADIDALFENGPQRTQTATEAAFQAQFVSMIGDVPFFLNSLGAGIVAAMLLAILNTMWMSAREQVRDVGVLKAVGFADGAVAWTMLSQSFALCGLGGGLGLLLAVASAPRVASWIGAQFPGYAVTGEVMLWAAVLVVTTALAAGAAPAWRARRLPAVECLRAEV